VPRRRTDPISEPIFYAAFRGIASCNYTQTIYRLYMGGDFIGAGVPLGFRVTVIVPAQIL